MCRPRIKTLELRPGFGGFSGSRQGCEQPGRRGAGGAKIKRRSRGCGAFQAMAPPRNDGGDHRILRHFNIIAYGWILGPQ